MTISFVRFMLDLQEKWASYKQLCRACKYFCCFSYATHTSEQKMQSFGQLFTNFELPNLNASTVPLVRLDPVNIRAWSDIFAPF